MFSAVITNHSRNYFRCKLSSYGHYSFTSSNSFNPGVFSELSKVKAMRQSC